MHRPDATALDTIQFKNFPLLTSVSKVLFDCSYAADDVSGSKKKEEKKLTHIPLPLRQVRILPQLELLSMRLHEEVCAHLFAAPLLCQGEEVPTETSL